MKLNEKLGVPKGIDEQAIDLYNKLLVDLDKLAANKKIPMPKLSKDNRSSIMDIGEYDLKIKDMYLENIPFTIRLFYHEDVTKPEVASAGYANTDTKLISKNNNIVMDQVAEGSILTVDVAVTTSSTKEEVVSEIAKVIKPDTIAHELMHMYDAHKKRNSSIEASAKYQSYSQSGFPKEVGEFLYLLYFTTSTENTVRPTELYRNLLDNGITKSEFGNFLKDNRVIKTLESAEKFSLKELMDKLNNSEEAKKFIEDIIENSNYVSKGNTAFDVLNILMNTLLGNTINNLRDMLSDYIGSSLSVSDRLGMMFGRSSDRVSELEAEASRNLNRIIFKYQKYENNPIKYFEHLEKSVNFVGSKMKRKLYKLYDMVADNKEKGSILNWDLHTKINSRGKKNEGIILKFDLFKNKLK